MLYELEFSEQAKRDLLELKKSDISSYKKVAKLLEELQEHPTTGTGKPEQLKHELSAKGLRESTKKIVWFIRLMKNPKQSIFFPL